MTNANQDRLSFKQAIVFVKRSKQAANCAANPEMVSIQDVWLGQELAKIVDPLVRLCFTINNGAT